MENIKLCDDGAYRWQYTLNMYKDPNILLLIWTYGPILFITFVMCSLYALRRRVISLEVIMLSLKISSGCAAIMLVILLIFYYIFALCKGGKDIMTFEMDEKGIRPQQIERKVKKWRFLGGIITLIGVVTKSIWIVIWGVWIVVIAKDIDVPFAQVRTIKAVKKHAYIRVREIISTNYVYADGEDFDFALDYIVKRCPNAKVTIK